MSWFMGVGYQQYKVEDDGRVFTLGGVEVDPITLQPREFKFTVPKPEGYYSSFDVFSEPEDIHLLTCEKCGKVCKSVAGLAVHLRSHKEE